MARLFGTDGVRGVANSELTPELALNLGRAGVYVLTKEKKHAPKILLCKDTRVSGDMLEAALAAGMCSLGAEVYLAGVLPTPGVAYLVRKYGFDAGVVISASHNPVRDNGIKFFNGDGYKLPDAMEDEIEEIYNNGLNSLPRPIGEQVGRVFPCPEALEDYCAFLASTVQGNGGGQPLSGLRVAVDCANGATYKAAAVVLKNLGADVMIIHNEPDGYNINDDCGSTHIGSLVEYVKETGADIGLAFDGDGDRVLAVDERGYELNGDEIMSICGHYLKEKGRLKSDTLVVTVMSNLGLFLMGDKYGINVEKTAVGDRYVLERMMEGGYSLGGENSGHIIFLEYNTTGDGILTGVQLLSIMKETGKKLSELNTLMELLPQVLVNARVNNANKYEYMKYEEIKAEIEALENRFAGEGRVLIRPSGTEPLIRVMLEGRDQEQLQAEAVRIAGLMEKLLS